MEQNPNYEGRNNIDNQMLAIINSEQKKGPVMRVEDFEDDKHIRNQSSPFQSEEKKFMLKGLELSDVIKEEAVENSDILDKDLKHTPKNEIYSSETTKYFNNQPVFKGSARDSAILTNTDWNEEKKSTIFHAENSMNKSLYKTNSTK
mmetsp:Transcript_15170/g.13305  ORF Transcript_15170/g.13305 Transcript_15170/m.13305 type:complete len:147 (+) Transcript_15170:133-573(+)|eukprot:CAMPEP_0205810082 /NCGR_PEP_ID=MMETSP0205-20121125/14272_1 /ASSEMBLY_ACC=CAM_ASM_000278 /TAXON_ID=36767 /ORGANISM="Euplotes focardii, Strain TN1" /LENGTH=146 /DNA_ID=CAMNT_0053087877 /DNA_START=530 /DNA_END=970 /DNA_ORIENTATION=-